MTIKKIKLPSSPYSQLLVHNVAFAFSSKRHNQYGVTMVIGMLIRSRAIKESFRS